MGNPILMFEVSKKDLVNLDFDCSPNGNGALKNRPYTFHNFCSTIKKLLLILYRTNFEMGNMNYERVNLKHTGKKNEDKLNASPYETKKAETFNLMWVTEISPSESTLIKFLSGKSESNFNLDFSKVQRAIL
jgi:hypothetical protein